MPVVLPCLKCKSNCLALLDFFICFVIDLTPKVFRKRSSQREFPLFCIM